MGDSGGVSEAAVCIGGDAAVEESSGCMVV